MDIGSSLKPELCHQEKNDHGHNYWKTEEQRQHFIAHNLRKRCIKKGFEGFTTASKTTQHFVNRYSALIELKRYASRWTKTRRKISPIE